MHHDPVVIVLRETLDLVAPTGGVRIFIIFVLVLVLFLLFSSSYSRPRPLPRLLPHPLPLPRIPVVCCYWVNLQSLTPLFIRLPKGVRWWGNRMADGVRLWSSPVFLPRPRRVRGTARSPNTYLASQHQHYQHHQHRCLYLVQGRCHRAKMKTYDSTQC